MVAPPPPPMLDVIVIGNFPQLPLNHSREKEGPLPQNHHSPLSR